jgi:hypothetical protein
MNGFSTSTAGTLLTMFERKAVELQTTDSADDLRRKHAVF